jgi:hydrogenase large subunit
MRMKIATVEKPDLSGATKKLRPSSVTIKLDPVTRIEGHLSIEVTIEGGKVIDAKSSGTMFRGFEIMLKGRKPTDAPHITQRICGVCPVSHGLASCLAIENANGTVIPDNARIMRNLILGSNYLQSHTLHFYHLAAVDYINTEGLLPVGPWEPNYTAPDMVTGSTASTLVQHYVQALAIRRKAHQMGAIFGGKLPCTPVFVPGGVTEVPTTDKIASFGSLLAEIQSFIDNVFVPDVMLLGQSFPDYYTIGKGYANLLAYGVFDLNQSGSTKLFSRGRYTDGSYYGVDTSKIAEYVAYSRYANETSGLAPSSGVTAPEPDKSGAYSWLKSPRYLSRPHELGPLARMWISGKYRRGISAMDRIVARALEAQILAQAMAGWLASLVPGGAVYVKPSFLSASKGEGLTEAARGALGHWIGVESGNIDRYQVVAPTSWNASPKDDFGQRGPIEQALVGVPVSNPDQPVEVLRVVHSFDPCLACSVHILRPNRV